MGERKKIKKGEGKIKKRKENIRKIKIKNKSKEIK
jgi:hypothetical protein